VQGAGCRVQGAGCRVQGAGCRVQGAGFRVQDVVCRVKAVRETLNRGGCGWGLASHHLDRARYSRGSSVTCRGTSLMKNSTPLGPYSRTMQPRLSLLRPRQVNSQNPKS